MLISEVYHRHAKTISPDMEVVDVVARLEHDHVNGFIVVDDQGKVVGVVSLQDVAAAAIPQEFKDNINMAKAMYKRGFFHEMCQTIKHWPVNKVMRKKFVSVDLETNIMAVITDFLVGDLYIVPVVEKGELVGIVTRTEIKHALAKGMHVD